MGIIQSRYFRLSFYIFFSVFIVVNTISGQQKNGSEHTVVSKKNNFKQDSIVQQKAKSVYVAEPDTNFTFEKYAALLTGISDTSKYIVLPINEFRQTSNRNKIVIGLRHDVDNDLNIAYQFSQTESNLGFRSTYYILHTAPYYLVNPGNKLLHTENILPTLKAMQNNKHFEIGWHNDLVTLQAVYNIDPVSFLRNELAWLRTNGIKIYGSASHGSPYCYTYLYMNYYFFEECTYPVVGKFVNNLTLPVGGITVPMKKGKFSDFELKYEAYFLDNNKYFSDATITNGIRWNIGMLDLNQLKAGDRVIILLHPVHWHKASIDARIESFTMEGQKSSFIDASKSVITVTMPGGQDKNSMVAAFSLSPGAYAKVSGKMQTSNVTVNNFSTPLVYTVFAENRAITREWTIVVKYEFESGNNFESFVIPGVTRTVNINLLLKTIFIEVNAGANLTGLPVQFTISPGAKVYIGNEEQFSNVSITDFSRSVQYRIVAEDGVTSGLWTVTVVQNTLGVENNILKQKGLWIYPNPSDGQFNLQFSKMPSPLTKIDVYNTMGEKVYSELLSITGTLVVKSDLRRLGAGVYVIRTSDSENSVVAIIHEH